MAMASGASVTVSMAAEITGVLMRMRLVSWVETLASAGMTSVAFGHNKTSSQVRPTSANGLWAFATGSDDGPEVWSVTGSYPFKKSFGSHDKGFTTSNIPNVTHADVSSQTVNTSGPKHRRILTRRCLQSARHIALGSVVAPLPRRLR